MTTLIRLGARLRAARKAAGFKTAKAFLKKHKVPASTYSQHESGARTPDEEGLKFYAKVFDVDFDWLKTGKGQPFKKITPFKKEVFAEESLDLIHTNPIRQELLVKVLVQSLNSYKIKLPIKSIQSIAKKSAEAYHQQAILKQSPTKNLIK